jgi:glycosyltransferase involved in cell wall biosynthesis
MSVSIVIPVYNEEDYLDACLSALEKQTERPDEVIVVDNDSTDGSLATARRYSFVRIVSEPRRGRIFAQNAGFAAAKSDVIARIDADTVLPPEWVALVKEAFKSRPDAAAVTGGPRFYDTPLAGLIDSAQVLLYQRLQKLLTGTYILWGANMAVRREAWLKVRSELSERTDIDEDIDLSFCLHKHGLRVCYLRNLRAGASLQRGRTHLLYTLRYLSTWPRDYWMHGMYLRGALIAVLTWAGVLLTAPLMWLLRRLRSADSTSSRRRQ